MDKKEFMKSAKRKGIPNLLYNIDGKGRDDERFCLVTDSGKWNVYYAERGCQTTDLYFDTESEALEYMLKELSEER